MLCSWPGCGPARGYSFQASFMAMRTVARRQSIPGRQQRRPGFSDILKVCYSSVFAAATIIDGMHKAGRRRELDRQLAEARRELGDLQDRWATSAWNPDGPVDPRTRELSLDQMDALWESLKDICGNLPYMKEIHKPAVANASQLVKSLKREYHCCPTETLLRAGRETNWEVLERKIQAEETDDTIISRDSKTVVHLARETSAVRAVIAKLLRRAEVLDKEHKPCPSWAEAHILLATSRRTYSLRYINRERAMNDTVFLNQRLRSICNSPELGLKEMIGRICYNILIAPYAPNIQTYNTLIVALDKIGQHVLSDAFIYSFFHTQLLRPTACTFTAILNHHQCYGNHGKFLHTLACMSGVDHVSGAKVRRRHINSIELDRRLISWASESRLRTLTGDYVWEHVPWTQDLVVQVIKGLLHFNLFEQAVVFFITCLNFGVDVGTKMVHQVMDECAAALDWKGSLALIRGLASCKNWKEMLLTGDESADRYLISRIHTLVDLCGLRSPGREALSAAGLANLDVLESELTMLLEDLSEAETLASRSMPWVEFAMVQAIRDCDSTVAWKSRRLQLESIWKEYIFVRKTTHSIESKLLYPHFSMNFRISMALHIVKETIRQTTQLLQEFSELSGGRGEGNREDKGAYSKEGIPEPTALISWTCPEMKLILRTFTKTLPVLTVNGSRVRK